MELVFGQLTGLLSTLWWPFCRILAMLGAAPVLGDNMVPISIRVLLALVLAIVMLPLTHTVAPIDPFSLHGVVATANQALIGFMLGLAIHLTVAAIMVLGYLVSSQTGLAMAVMNDPMNGTSSDVISSMLYVLFILVFFSIDGHLVLVGILSESFRVWPVSDDFSIPNLQPLALSAAWIFSAALLLAIPIIFSTLIVQIGFGFLNRASPALNLYSLGFSLITVFGLFMLMKMVRFIPQHYVQLINRVLEMLRHNLMG